MVIWIDNPDLADLDESWIEASTGKYYLSVEEADELAKTIKEKLSSAPSYRFMIRYEPEEGQVVVRIRYRKDDLEIRIQECIDEFLADLKTRAQ